MANFNKSFNFRNGVQVDNDNFVINANGLVGIGTSIPTELLDVYGDVRVVGVISATEIKTQRVIASGISTFSTLRVGIVSITSGIVTASSSSGIVTYYGDGSKLLNIPTSQWIDVDNGPGYISIYSAGNVGIATTNPRFTFQVGPNPVGNSRGIGISSSGDIYSAGIITATSFSGIGSYISDIDASNINSGTLSTSFFPSSITLSGSITASSFIGSGAGITAINATNITSGTLSTSRLPQDIVVSGIITALTFVGDLRGNVIGIASTALSLSSSASISINSVTSGFTSTGIATVTDTLYVVGYPAKIGVGTITAPEADIEVNKTGISSIRVISGTNVATIGIGRSAEIRTGNIDPFYSYSTRNSLDIINSNGENVNYYLDYGSAGIGTGNFNWIYGQNPSYPLMSLTYDGKLGLGITNPSSRLYVNGTSYITGITTIDSNLTVTGDITFNGSIIGNLGITTLSRLGIATDTISSNLYEFFVGGDPTIGDGVSITKTKIRASESIQSVNIISTNINNSGVITSSSFKGSSVLVDNIGIGTTSPIGAIDTRYASLDTSYRATFYPPILTTTERTTITSAGIVTSGAIIYNSTTGNHQAYDGSSWAPVGLTGTQDINVGVITATKLVIGTSGTTITTNNNLVGIGTTTPQGILDLVSTTNPFYLPRMTMAQRNAMVGVSSGAMIFNTSLIEFQGYTGVAWVTIGV